MFHPECSDLCSVTLWESKEIFLQCMINHLAPIFFSLLTLIFSNFVSEPLHILSPLSSCLCRECEGCGGEEGEAVAEEESQAGDQRRQDREQSLGESTHAAFKLLLH